jgi:hypothetical protein
VSNPWTKKNPLMSMWLSGANALAGRARSAGTAEVNRQRTSLTERAARFWSGARLALWDEDRARLVPFREAGRSAGQP